MTKDEAFVLFERILNALSPLPGTLEVKLIYTQQAETRPFPRKEWMIVIDDEVIECSAHWEEYKRDYHVVEVVS